MYQLCSSAKKIMYSESINTYNTAVCTERRDNFYCGNSTEWGSMMNLLLRPGLTSEIYFSEPHCKKF